MFNDLINIDLFLKNTTNIIYQTLEKSNKKIEELLKGGNFRSASLKKAQKTAISTKEMEETNQIVQKLKVLKKKKC